MESLESKRSSINEFTYFVAKSLKKKKAENILNYPPSDDDFNEEIVYDDQAVQRFNIRDTFDNYASHVLPQKRCDFLDYSEFSSWI
jgi:hypothetical protein